MCLSTFLDIAFLVFPYLLASFANRYAEVLFLWLQGGNNNADGVRVC